MIRTIKVVECDGCSITVDGEAMPDEWDVLSISCAFHEDMEFIYCPECAPAARLVIKEFNSRQKKEAACQDES